MKVRIAVAINENGGWAASAGMFGCSDIEVQAAVNERVSDDGTLHTDMYWVEVELPLPQVPVVQGTIVP